MRILIATHFFGEDLIGGTEVLTLNLASQLRHAGHDVAVICADDWDTAPDDQVRISDSDVQGIPVRRLHFNWTKAPDVFRYLYDNPVAEAHTAEYIDAFQPDVLHITSCYSLSGSVIPAARSRGVPIVLTATDYWFLCGRNTLLRSDQSLCDRPASAWDCTQCMLADTKVFRLTSSILPEPVAKAGFRALGRRPALTRQRGLRGLHGDWDHRRSTLRRLLRDIDLIVTASNHLRERLIEFGAHPGRVISSAYGIDASWAVGHTRKTASPVLRFGFIGQAIPMKGIDILLRAATALPDDVRFELKIYGNLDKDGDYAADLRQRAASDPRVRFCGTFSSEEMGHVLSSIDILVVPSVWYDFPLVIPSAFATRTPVIATNLPGMNELVSDGVTGYLFERGNWRQLSELMSSLVRHKERAEKLASHIPPVKTAHHMAIEYVHHYRRIASSSNHLAGAVAGSVDSVAIGE